MKYIVLVPDGMADYPIKELGDRTPLEAAHKANMNYLAAHGITGLVQTIPDGMPPGSDIGNLAILGYDPTKCFSGRAALEAASIGVELSDDEVAFRCNLVTICDGKMEDYSAGHIPTKEAGILIHALNKNFKETDVKFYAGKSYRHLMVIKTKYVEEFSGIKSTPPHDILGQEINPYLPKGKQADVILDLMEKSKKIFEDHPVNQVRIDLKENPANMIWLWGQGTRPWLPAFSAKFGVEGSIISAVDLVKGIGQLAGLDVIKVPKVTGYYDTNYVGKARYALNSLKKKDFVFVHVEATDEAGHNGDVKMKLACIERFDREVVGTIINGLKNRNDVRILVLPDHATPIEKRTHTSDPVCFVMYGKGITPDNSAEYSESAAKTKGLKFKSGEELMNYFMRGNN